MLIAILSVVSLILIFIGSIFTAAGFDFLEAGGKNTVSGFKSYAVGFSMMVAACAASFYAGAIS